MRRIAVVALFLAALASLPAAAARRPFEFESATLDNGLQVVTLEDFSCPIAAVQLWYHVGSKNESPARQGFAHMFEHMMFRGTDLLGPEEHFALIRRTGGHCNAFTSFDYTAYVDLVPANQVELAFWLEAERMMFLAVDQDGFETERRVVEEERRMDLNEPYGTVFEQVMPVVFREHPYRWLPIGKIAHLERAGLDELKAFWNTFYVPGNAVLVVAGAVRHEDARALAERYFGWMPALAAPPPVTIREPAQTEPRAVTIREPIGPAPLVRLVYRGVPRAHPDFSALQVLVDVLGAGQSSRLYQDLVRDKKVSQDAFGYLYGLEQDGLATFGAELLPDGDVEGTLQLLDQHVARMLAAPAPAREIEKAKNQLRREIVTDALTVEAKARLLGRAWIQYGDAARVNDWLGEIDAVTPADVERVARAYLAPERATTVRVTPDKEYTYVPDAGADEAYAAPAGADAKAGVARPASFPSAPPTNALLDAMPETSSVERVLPNGLKVVVIPNHEAPFVTVMLGLKHGAWTAPADMPGVASMALEMLTKGTQSYGAAELAELLEFNAITLAGAAAADGRPSMDVGEVVATALADKLPLAVELLAEVVMRPAFPAGELDILKEQRRLALSVKEKDPAYLADRQFQRVLYGDHPYARTPEGDLAQIDAVAREAVAEWWRLHARPDTAVLYLAGDVKPRRAFRLAAAHLGAWQPDGPRPEPELPPVPPRAGTHIYIVDRPGAVQSQIRIGQTSITRSHPDYHVSRVYSHVLGSGFNSRLNRTVRVEKGLTYAAWGFIRPQQHSGELLCSTFTKTETTAEAVQAVLDVIRGMAEEPPNGDELDAAKSYLVGSFPGQLETPADAMAYAWLIDYNGLPDDYLLRAAEAYRAATQDDIQRVARDAVDPGRLAIIVVGDAAVIRAGLEGIAFVTVLDNPDN
ncbi:MAG: insulinase family protein [Candidatus Hydrogenedentes bacterium]|nr:insulinase family protein [Candidatus Hydrogenedentota bacterium]